MSPPRLYVDEDAAERAVLSVLQQCGVNILTAQEADALQLDDESQLRLATSLDRALYSLNVRDFARLHREFCSRGEVHSGIILIPRQRYSIGEKARRLRELLQAIDTASLRNSLHFL